MSTPGTWSVAYQHLVHGDPHCPIKMIEQTYPTTSEAFVRVATEMGRQYMAVREITQPDETEGKYMLLAAIPLPPPVLLMLLSGAISDASEHIKGAIPDFIIYVWDSARIDGPDAIDADVARRADDSDVLAAMEAQFQ